ncbi:MAG: hypothetical protein H2058_13355 [Muricauda sp.]|nr:hypothetical protein [Allomuricauda sp.]MBA4746237.1 hypothetical protein [Allomuricauda sp.]
MKKLFSLLSVLVIGCSSDNSDAEVYIRLSNVSTYDYQNITVNTSTGPLDYDNLDSGEISEYQVVAKAYSYAFVELEIAEETYTIQPIDYVGESTLSSGYYTYQTDANDTTEQYGRLSISLVKD